MFGFTKNQYLLAGALVIFLISIATYGFYTYRSFLHDDAFITLRYSHNFINGKGIVWNAGEYVEGYTSFLFLLLISVLGKLGVDLLISARLIGLISYCGIIICFVLFLRRFYSEENPAPLRFVPLMLTATSYPLIVWSLGGLETCLFALLCFIALGVFSETMNTTSRAGLFGGICFSLLAMTRPEGVLFFLIACLFILAERSGRKINDFGLVFLLTFGIIFGSYLVWRVIYYGTLLPNPYFVKTGFDLWKLASGIKYYREFSLTPPYLIPLVALGTGYVYLKQKLDKKILYLLCCIVAYVFYVLAVGGDHMPAFRFFAHLIPILALAVFHILKTGVINLNLALLLAMVAISLQVIVPGKALKQAEKMDAAAFVGSIVGKYIARTFPTGSLIALNTAGSAPYYAINMQFIDMLGLNDRTIARRKITNRVLPWQFTPGHEKGDGKYVLSRSPDYIIIGYAEGNLITQPIFLSDLEIGQEDSFYANYQLQEVKLDVSKIPGYQNYTATASGTLTFRYYKRKN